MNRFSFVILHYYTVEDTIECVNSILENIKSYKVSIVIVDNASKNNSYRILLSKFSDVDNIHIIKSEKNLGFANGNNLGYLYAKDKLKSDFICLLNNDTVINQYDFVDKCIDKFEESKYYILGPDIVSTVDYKHQNPHKFGVMDIKKINSLLIQLYIHGIFSYIGIELYINWLLKKIKELSKLKCDDYKSKDNLILHGSCLIFSPLYVNKYSGLCKKTFMYGEEEILFYICKKLNLKVEYYPEILIYHKEGSSTDSILVGSKRNKYLFYYKNKIQSTHALRKIIRMTKDKEVEKELL